MGKYEGIAERLAAQYGVSWTPAAPRVVNGRLVFGRANRDGTFEAPRPNSPRRLLVWLHELGHVVTGEYVDGAENMYPAEKAAWEWALQTFRGTVGEPSTSALRWIEDTLDEVVSRVLAFALSDVEEFA